MTDEHGFRAMQRFPAARGRRRRRCSAPARCWRSAPCGRQPGGAEDRRDISLIAHDDVLPMLKPENFMVPLTTTRSSLRAAGQRIARRLIASILQLETLPQQELWKADLIVRASTGARATRNGSQASRRGASRLSKVQNFGGVSPALR
jgi:LacI family transcriptional regulator